MGLKFNIGDVVITPNQGSGVIKSISLSSTMMNNKIYLVYHDIIDEEYWYSEDYLKSVNGDMYLTE